MRKEEFYFDSRDGQTKIFAVRYTPDGDNVTGILQIIHGMAEHIERYEEFARYMTDNGYVVTGECHLGHGKSVGEDGQRGFFCSNDPATVVVRDAHRLKKLTQELYPGVPYFILGHSMGSFILRNYIGKYGSGIQGAIIMGTGLIPGALLKVSKTMAAMQKFFCGERHVSKFIDVAAFGAYGKKVENPRTTFDWLTKDEAIVDAYMADPDCGFTFTVNGFGTMFELIGRMTKREDLQAIPKALPLFLVSGDADPVGDYGKGVTASCEMYRDLGIEDVTMKLYENDRHEILNETDRMQVMEDILGWLQSHVSA